jgi:hypothetical protein
VARGISVTVSEGMAILIKPLSGDGRLGFGRSSICAARRFERRNFERSPAPGHYRLRLAFKQFPLRVHRAPL